MDSGFVRKVVDETFIYMARLVIAAMLIGFAIGGGVVFVAMKYFIHGAVK